MFSRITALLASLLGLALCLVPAVARADAPFVSPSGGNYTTVFCLFADGFKPYEEIALWVGLPDGTVESFGDTFATGSGSVGHTEGYAGYACFFGSPTWHDGEVLAVARGKSSHHEASAKFLYDGGFADPDGPGVHVTLVPGAPRDTPYITVAGSGFKPYERVSVWLGNPDGSVQNFGDLDADGWGKVYLAFSPTFRPGPGDYTIVVRSASGIEYSSRFTFPGVNNPLPDSGVRVNPDNGTYQTSIIINGAGFDPFEWVNVWVALPTGEPYDLGTLSASAEGRVLTLWLAYPGEPFGVYTVVMVGQSSHRRYTATFDIHPIPLDP